MSNLLTLMELVHYALIDCDAYLLLIDPHFHLLQLLRPVRTHIVGVVMRRGADFRQIGRAVIDLARDPDRVAPGSRLGDAQRLALAGEGELAGQVAVAVLVDHAADAARIEPALHAVEHHLRHRRLSLERLGAGLEIDGFREAALFFRHALRRDQLGVVLLHARLGEAQVAIGRRRGQRDAPALLRRGMSGQGRRRQRADDRADERRRGGGLARLRH